MKIRTFGYYVKQGLSSTFRNKMMSLASVSTVMASLLILGLYFITMVNVGALVKDVEAGVEIKVFLKDEITNNEMSALEEQVRNCPGVTSVIYESKQQAMENFKAQLGENADLVEDIDPEKVMPSSYIIKLSGPEYVDSVVQILNSLSGIDKINDARPMIEKLMQITSFIKNLGISLMVILLIVSIFLISNTIKLTVISRRREIGIMKYIGATDWFIRWPFVIEGVVLGLLGAFVSSVILGYGYIVASDAVFKELIYKLVEPVDIIPYMAALFGAVGIIIGALGSIVSVRKFLRV